MTSESENVTTPEKAAEKAGSPAPPGNDSPFAAVTELIKLAGSAYAVGFIVIMAHTASLHAPVVEALEFQNFVAGLPVWLPLCAGIWLWPKLARRFHAAQSEHKIELDWRKLGVWVAFFGIMTFVVYREIGWIAGRTFSVRESLVVVSAVVFAFFVSILVQLLYSRQFRFGPIATFFETTCVYTGIFCLIVAYALVGYPKLPQSLGGGQSVRVKLYFKNSEMREVLCGPMREARCEPSAPAGQNPPSDPVLLYYRTSSYLLVSPKEGLTLVQIPIDEIRAVDWIDSRSK